MTFNSNNIPIDAKVIRTIEPKQEHNYKKCGLCLLPIARRCWVYIIASLLKRPCKWSIHKKCWEKFEKKKNQHFSKKGV